MLTADTIVALSTPPGRGGIGVVRLSGDRALEITSQLISFRKSPPEIRRATLGAFCEPETGQTLDQVVVTYFQQTHSYTAEDVVEISCHGAPVILRYLIECALARGARLAEPGEFTMRAFLNGRLDLTQAEAVRDLVESQTLYQARVAAQQMEGALAARLKPHKKALVDLIALLEAGIDFAEDDVSVLSWPEINVRLETMQSDLHKLVDGYKYGKVVREGLSLAIVGRPNVGKSSLFNRLLEEERAIVTATPGTTRDLVAETANVGGIPLRFVDTAGIRAAKDEAEAKGVEKSFQAIADSDLRLLVVDSAEPWTAEDTGLLEKIRPLGALLVAFNKSDLPPRLTAQDLGRLQSSDESAGASPATVVWTSALTGNGIAELREKILEVAVPAHSLGPEGELITNLRHEQLLNQSLAALASARQAAQEEIHHEMLLLDLYEALRPLDELTGATYVEDLLNVIFSTFCVGK